MREGPLDRAKKPHKDASAETLQAADRLRLLEDLGDIYFSADAYPQAMEEYRRGLADLPAEQAFDVLLQIARCHHGQGDYRDALESLARIEEEFGAELGTVARGKLLAMYGHTHRALGQYGKAKAACEEALENLRGSGEDAEIASVQLCYGAVLHRLGQLDRARRLYEDALSTYRQIEDQPGLAMAYNNLGIVYMNLCSWDRAAEYLLEAREIAEVLGNYSKIALRTANLGMVRFHQGRWAEADECYRKSLRVYREIGYSRGTAKVSFELGRLERARGHHDKARSVIEEGLRLAEQNGYRREISVGHEFLGELCHEVGRLDEAESHYSRGLEVAEAIAPQSDHISEVCRRWAELAVAAGEPDKALSMAERALATAIRIQDRLEEGLSHRALGQAYARMGERDRGSEHLARAEDQVRVCECPHELAKTLLVFGEFHAGHPAEGSDERALRQLREAERIFDRLGDKRGTGRAALRRAQMLLKLDETDGCLDVLERAEALLTEAGDQVHLDQVTVLREELEERLLEEARSDRNRLALLVRWGRGRECSVDGMLRFAVRAVGADRGFVAARGEEGRAEVEACVGFERRRAAGLLEELLAGEDLSEPRLVLDAAERLESAGTVPVKSYVLLPMGEGEGEGRWVYLDRVAGGRGGRFGRREIDFLVAFLEMAARTIFAHQAPAPGGGVTGSRPCCTLDDVVTENAALKRILRLVPKISWSNISVLLRGETGTGKQLLAEAIHAASDRCDRPFVTVSCAALPEGLLETELFGHLRGSFTGALRDKPGLIEEADGGTLFLDEIEKASVVVQGKLLHVLDTGEMRPVGSTKVRAVDIRVICATSKMDLETEIKEGRFLGDLFYRLNDILLTLPPLRERREDIPVLARHFLGVYAAKFGRRIPEIAPASLEILSRYAWPGNVRELEKAVKLAVVLADDGGMILPEHLPREVARGSAARAVPKDGGRGLRDVVESVERDEIVNALEACGGNKSEAARMLGITRKGLANKIRRYHIDTP